MMGAAMNKQEFTRALNELRNEQENSAANPGSFECKNCLQCTTCMFCKGCKACYKCTHCTGCELCSHASHSVDCHHCHNCAYCIRSESCSGSTYLVLCYSCTDCTYCFGCVGLGKQEFCILNEQYSRDDYFNLVSDLKRTLSIR